MIIENTNIYQDGKWLEGHIEFDDTFKAISCDNTGINKGKTIDAHGMYLIPGFIDIHTHGAINIDVNHLENCEEVDELSLFYASHGTTSFLSSVMSDSVSQTEKVIKILRSSIEKSTPGANLIGIHLEGPFISKEYKGAMNDEYLIEADEDLLKHYIELSGDNIKYMTVASEVLGVNDIIKKYSDKIVFSLGHSGAPYECCMTAIRNGATSITHTFNAMKLFHQHFPSISGAALESDAYCEAICDGFHLVPATVRILLKAKGYDRVIAITDSMMAAGLDEGTYKLGPNTVVVKGGDAKLLDGVRAGSTLTQDVALKNLVAFTKNSLEKIVPLLTKNPACLLNIYDKKGSVDIGKDADFMLIDKDLNIVKTFVGGKLVFDKSNKL
jgi:N-acetylglucosamine-6-phosphate deacetylase